MPQAEDRPVAHESPQADHAVQGRGLVGQLKIAPLVDQAAAADDGPTDQKRQHLLAEAAERSKPQGGIGQHCQRRGDHARQPGERKLQPHRPGRRFAVNVFQIAAKQGPRQPLGPPHQPLADQIDERRGQGIHDDALVDDPQHEPRHEAQRSHGHQSQAPQPQPPTRGEDGVVAFLGAVDIAGRVAVILYKPHHAARRFGDRLGQQLVLGSLPGDDLPGRAAFGSRTFHESAADRGSLGFEPDGASCRVKDSFFHVPRRNRRQSAAQRGDQIAKQAIATAPAGLAFGGHHQGILGFQAVQALEDIRLIRHRGGLPYLQGRCRGRSRCRGESPPASPGAKPTRSWQSNRGPQPLHWPQVPSLPIRWLQQIRA